MSWNKRNRFAVILNTAIDWLKLNLSKCMNGSSVSAPLFRLKTLLLLNTSAKLSVSINHGVKSLTRNKLLMNAKKEGPNRQRVGSLPNLQSQRAACDRRGRSRRSNENCCSRLFERSKVMLIHFDCLISKFNQFKKLMFRSGFLFALISYKYSFR